MYTNYTRITGSNTSIVTNSVTVIVINSNTTSYISNCNDVVVVVDELI